MSAVWTGYARVMASEKLKVTQVMVRGQHFLSEGEVRQLMGASIGENILTVDLDALKHRLRGSPWVADATVRRTLPDTLHVEIKDKKYSDMANSDAASLAHLEERVEEDFMQNAFIQDELLRFIADAEIRQEPIAGSVDEPVLPDA